MTGWRDAAACATIAPDLWFPNAGEDTTRPRRICNEECPVRTQCLDAALDGNEGFGIWGGLLTQERKKLRRTA